MKTLVVAACALLLGLFLGGLRPRAELRRLERELAEAREAAARADGPDVLPLALGALSAAAGERPRGALPPPRFVPAPPEPAAAAPEPRPGDRPDGGPRRRFFGALRDESSFQAAKAAADVRAAQFRAAFFEQARLAPDKQAAVDETIKAMNEELGQAASSLAESLRGRARVSPRDMADATAKFLEVYRRADDRLKAGLDQTALEALDRARFDLTTQIDLAAFRELIPVAEALRREQR